MVVTSKIKTFYEVNDPGPRVQDASQSCPRILRNLQANNPSWANVEIKKNKNIFSFGLNYETKDYIHKSLGHVFTQKIISSDFWI